MKIRLSPASSRYPCKPISSERKTAHVDGRDGRAIGRRRQPIGQKHLSARIHHIEHDVKLRHGCVRRRIDIDGDSRDLALVAEHHAAIVREQQIGLKRRGNLAAQKKPFEP